MALAGVAPLVRTSSPKQKVSGSIPRWDASRSQPIDVPPSPFLFVSGSNGKVSFGEDLKKKEKDFS